MIEYYSSRVTKDGVRKECRACMMQTAKMKARAKARRRDEVGDRPAAGEEFLGGERKEREVRLDLGLAIARATCEPGQCRTLEELAAYGGVTAQAIRRIEQQAMRKVRDRLLESMGEMGISTKEVGL